MICYLDRAFCAWSLRGGGAQQCVNSECSRALTDEHRAASEKWWGGPGAPISTMDFKRDDCGYTPPLQQEQTGET
jgi:hypothetical protein